MRKIVTAAQYYKAFVKSLVAQETNTTELSISQTMGDTSSDGKPCEVTQRKEIALSENKKEDNVLITYLRGKGYKASFIFILWG